MLIQPNGLNLAILTVHVKQVPVQHGNLHWTLPAGGSLRGWQTEQVVAVRINYQQWALLFAIGVFLSRLPIALSQDQTQSPKSVALGTVKHAGGKDDIQAIGNRTIGKRGFGNWYSPEQEIKLGREYSHAIENGASFVDDPVITEYVNRIGQNLIRNSDATVPFTIKVIDCGDINAYALPGGFLYVNSGLILAADDEAELAGVMAHEIAHVAAHHRTRQITRSQLLNFASMPLIFFGGGVGIAVQQLSMPKVSRGFETEADYLGVEYLYKAGYDPQAYISFFERVQVLEDHNLGFITKFFASHPPTANRIQKTQREIARILPNRDVYVLTTSEFEDVKLRLAIYEGRRPTNDEDMDPLTLRRKDTESASDNDQPPTLKR